MEFVVHKTLQFQDYHVTKFLRICVQVYTTYVDNLLVYIDLVLSLRMKKYIY